MKIIVDPDFPNPQLFVDIIHQVAERFMDRMIHKSILAGKLATVEIHMHLRVPTEEECDLFEKRKVKMLSSGNSLPTCIYEHLLNETVYDSLCTKGIHHTQFENNCVYSIIDIYAIPSRCLREFAEVVAHEMTHMLISESHNFYNAGKPLECGTIPSGSSVYRYDPERNITYGVQMEEIATHSVGYWLAKDLPLPMSQEDEELYYPEFPRIELCSLMADAFGEPLQELNYLDAFSVSENGVVFPNIFWYSFAVNQFGCIISIFNEVMGDCAYEELCEYLDECYSKNHDQYYEKAYEMLQSFSQKMAERA